MVATLVIAAVASVLCMVGALLLGSTGLDLGAALSDSTSVDHVILTEHRLPRVLIGFLVGATLASAGAALQGLLRNPLADPFILGVSGGAALGTTLVTVVGLGATTAVWGEVGGGFAGALAALLVLTALSTRAGRIDPLNLLLLGVIFNAFAGAAITIVQSLAEPGAVQRVLMRLMGTLSSDPARPWDLPLLAVVTSLTALVLIRSARSLDLLALGDTTASSLGVEPERLRRRVFVVLSLAVGAVVAVSGMIGFVGLIVPHLLRRMVGPDHRLLIPLCVLGGGAFLVVVDGLVRALATALGTELPVGAATALIGGPFFVLLLRSGGTSRA